MQVLETKHLLDFSRREVSVAESVDLGSQRSVHRTWLFGFMLSITSLGRALGPGTQYVSLETMVLIPFAFPQGWERSRTRSTLLPLPNHPIFGPRVHFCPCGCRVLLLSFGWENPLWIWRQVRRFQWKNIQANRKTQCMKVFFFCLEPVLGSLTCVSCSLCVHACKSRISVLPLPGPKAFDLYLLFLFLREVCST